MKLKITLNKKVYEVEVEPLDGPMPVAPMAPQSTFAFASQHVRPVTYTPPLPTPQNEKQKVIRCPISGIVAQVMVTVGEKVKAGQVLLVLEAMKMETDLTASFNGRIAAVNVKAGDGVQAGAVLVEFE